MQVMAPHICSADLIARIQWSPCTLHRDSPHLHRDWAQPCPIRGFAASDAPRGSCPPPQLCAPRHFSATKNLRKRMAFCDSYVVCLPSRVSRLRSAQLYTPSIGNPGGAAACPAPTVLALTLTMGFPDSRMESETPPKQHPALQPEGGPRYAASRLALRLPQTLKLVLHASVTAATLSITTGHLFALGRSSMRLSWSGVDDRASQRAHGHTYHTPQVQVTFKFLDATLGSLVRRDSDVLSDTLAATLRLGLRPDGRACD